MVGYWDASVPVRSSNPAIRATLYRGRDESFIALGNWSRSEQPAALVIDWERLGIDQAKATVSMPRIEGFQEGLGPVSLDGLTVPGGKGWILSIVPKK
jgi:hypothetical protein